jgi:hypothetical protein
MGVVTLEAGEVKDISPGNAETFRVEPENGQIKVSDRKRKASSGDRIIADEQVTVTLEGSDGLFAYNPTDGSVKVAVNPQGLIIANRSQIVQKTQDRNFGDVATETLEASSNDEAVTFSNQAVPDGSSVSVQAPDDNAGKVFVGSQDDTGLQLAPGQTTTLGVTNFNVVEGFISNSGDELRAIAEVQ